MLRLGGVKSFEQGAKTLRKFFVSEALQELKMVITSNAREKSSLNGIVWEGFDLSGAVNSDSRQKMRRPSLSLDDEAHNRRRSRWGIRIRNEVLGGVEKITGITEIPGERTMKTFQTTAKLAEDDSENVSKKAESIQICVRTISGKTVLIEVQMDDGIETLKKRLWHKEGIPVRLQRLILGSTELLDGRTAGSCNIKHGCTFQMLLRLRGGMETAHLEDEFQNEWKRKRIEKGLLTRLRNKACDAKSSEEKTEARLQYEEKYLELVEKLENLKDLGI